MPTPPVLSSSTYTPAPSSTRDQVRGLFNRYGVGIANGGEDENVRLDRIVNEVTSGQRNLTGVEDSIRGIAQRTPSPPTATPANRPTTPTGYFNNEDSLRSSIEGLFSRYGVPTTYYTDGSRANPEARLDRLTNEIVTGRRTFDQVRDSIELAGRGLDPNLRRAETTAGVEFDTRIQQLRTQLDQLGQQQQRDTGVAEQYGQFGDRALDEIYNLLGQQVGQNNQARNAAFDTAQGNNSRAYNLAGQVTQAAQQQALTQSNESADALGLQGAQTGVNSEINDVVSQMLSQNASSGANAASVLNNMRAGYGAIGSQAMTDVGLEEAQGRQQLGVSVSDMLGDVMSSYTDRRTTTMDDINNIFSERQGRVSELMREFEDQGYERNQQEILNNLAAEIQRGTLDLQRSELGFQRERFAGEMGLSGRQLDLDAELGRGEQGFRYAELQANTQIQRDQLNAQIAAEQDPLKRQLLQAQIAEINRGPANAPDSPYQQHLTTLSPTERSLWSTVDQTVARALTNSASPEVDGRPNPYYNMGAIAAANEIIRGMPFIPRSIDDRLRRAAQLAYGGGMYE